MTLDATCIHQHLYMGGFPAVGHGVRRGGFDVLVLCAKELQRPLSDFPGVEVFYVPLEDDSSKPVGIQDWEQIVRTSQRVVRRLRAGKKVLVTCQMGLNRSGIVTAASLHFLTGKSGCSTAKLVQRRRHSGGYDALFNRAFVRALCARLPGRQQ